MATQELRKHVYWHGSPSGTLHGSLSGIHIGTHKAAKEALEARIGTPAKGTWDGTREYGKTLLAGKQTLKKLGIWPCGLNCDAPEGDYYPSAGLATYSDSSAVSLQSKPVIFPVTIIGSMTNSPHNPHSDERANASMRTQIRRGTAKRGYFYANIGEDESSISAVVPGAGHLLIVNAALKKSA